MLAEWDLRVVVLALWGGGTLAVYAKALADSFGDWKEYHDRRALRDLMADVGFFLTAVASAAAITFVLFGQAGTGIRALASTVALGAFLAAGIVKASTRGGRVNE